VRDTPLQVGFKVFKLKGDTVFKLREAISKWTGRLEDYRGAIDPKCWTQDHVFLVKKFHEMNWKEILIQNKQTLYEIVGDFLYQKEPYLRIARPFKEEDNIGIHRDTDYGASKSEWVLWVPLTNAIKGGELGILPGSHLKDYSFTQEENKDVPKGSDKHWLGFRYAPKRFSEEVESQVMPIPCLAGEAIIFNTACIHGQKVNRASWTRFSIDIRLVNKDAEFTKSRGVHGEIYAQL
jgi:ectoine hydroxylase-related dioxygenase (phytanoyl-CoA dioxygenase family)